jgi:hypothetical protein
VPREDHEEIAERASRIWLAAGQANLNRDPGRLRRRMEDFRYLTVPTFKRSNDLDEQDLGAIMEMSLINEMERQEKERK